MLSGTKCSRNISDNGHLVNIGCILRHTIDVAQDDVLEACVASIWSKNVNINNIMFVPIWHTNLLNRLAGHVEKPMWRLLVNKNIKATCSKRCNVY